MMKASRPEWNVCVYSDEPADYDAPASEAEQCDKKAPGAPFCRVCASQWRRPVPREMSHQAIP